MSDDQVEVPRYEAPIIEERAEISHPLILTAHSTPPT